MTELSRTPTERARNAYSVFLNTMKPAGTAQKIAELMGTSETTISNIKNQKVEESLLLLYQLGFKVVPGDRVCVDRNMYDALATIAQRAMADKAACRNLIWEAEE